MIPTRANGCPAFAQYRPVPDEAGVWRPWNLQVLSVKDGKIASIDNFLNRVCRGLQLPAAIGRAVVRDREFEMSTLRLTADCAHRGNSAT